jgi:hypothetical protein
MSLIGDEIGAQNKDVDEDAPSPWETIEPEEADREPVEPAAAERIPPSPGTPEEGRGEGDLDHQRRTPFKGGGEGDSEHQRPPTLQITLTPTLSRSTGRGGSSSRPFPRLESAKSAPPVADSDESLPGLSQGGGWTIPLLCMGIGLIACCLIIPQADANRRMAYQKELLQRDLESIQKQVAVNDEFLKRVNDDSGLAERLAQRQMNIVRAGSRVWQPGQSADGDSTSPFAVMAVPKPVPLPAYQPVGGWFSALCRDARSNLYLTGVALLMLAAGLVMGVAPRSR